MFDEAAVERRLTALEQEVADLKRQLAIREPAENWLERVSHIITDKEALMKVSEYGKDIRQNEWLDRLTGSISDEAAFLEASEYGRAWRESDRPTNDDPPKQT